MTARKFFSGQSVEQAVLQAARHYGIEPEELAYRQVEKRHGFLKVRRNFVIEVDPESPRRAPEAEVVAGPEAAEQQPAPAPRPAREPAAAPPATPVEETMAATTPEAGEEPVAPAGEPEERTPHPPPAAHEELPAQHRPALQRYPRAEGPSADAAREALLRLFDLGKLSLEAEVLQGEELLEIEVWGGDEEILLRDRGRVLFTLQHLMPRLIRGLTGESAPCRVDCDNFHEIREERLRDLAQRTASEVHQGGRSRTLEPMAPDERRIVHLTLADDPLVETESRGRGLFKRVTVRPVRRPPRGIDSHDR